MRSLAAIVLSLATSAMADVGRPAQTNRQPRKPPVNQYGLPVVDADGQRRNYSREEIEAAAERMPEPPTAKAPAAAAHAVTAPAFTASQVWAYAAFGSGVGKSNITIALNGQSPEILLGGSVSTGGSNSYWHALRFSYADERYDQTYVSPYFGKFMPGIARIEVGEVDPNPGIEILVAVEDGRIDVHALGSKVWLREISTGISGVLGLAVANVDGDPANEILLCDADNLYVYSATGGLEWQLGGAGGQDLVVGQMDGDAALEIALTGGSIVDAETQAAQWTRAGGFGVDVEAADVDSDGMAELIVAEAWQLASAYDVDTKSAKWSIPTDLDIGAIHLTDIDSDGVVELLLGDGQWGSIHAFDTVTLAEEWAIPNPEHGVTDVTAADVDGDGEVEVIWGAGATSSGPDHLYVADWSTGQTEWSNVHLDGPFVGPERADIDGDGRPEVVVASDGTDSGSGGGRILVFDGTTLKLRAMSAPVVENLALSGLHDLRLRDVDGDGEAEILVASAYVYDGVIEIYDFDASNHFELKWTNATRPFGAGFYGVDAADIDGDGTLEIIGGVGPEHSGAEGTFIYVYDYATAQQEWRSPRIGPFWDVITSLRIGDADQDGAKEILGQVREGDLYIFDGPSKTLEDVLPSQGTALQLFGSGGASPRIMVGNAAGDLTTYKFVGGSYQQTQQRNYAPGLIDGFERVEGGGFWVGSEGTLRLTSNTGATLWQSDSYGTVFGRRTLALSPRRFLAAGSYAVVGFLGSNTLQSPE